MRCLLVWCHLNKWSGYLFNMKKTIRLTESDLTRLIRQMINEQNTVATGTNQQQAGQQQGQKAPCPDPKNPNSYPGVRYVKGLQGLLNKVLKSGLAVDGKYGPKTSEALKKYITSKSMTPVVGTKNFTGSQAGLIDYSFNGDKSLSDKLFNFLVQDGFKSFIPPVPEGCQKFKFDN